MNGKRLNEEQMAQVATIIAPIVAAYVPNYVRNFAEVANTGIYNLHTATGGGTLELAQRLIAALQTAGFAAEWLPGNIVLRVPVPVPVSPTDKMNCQHCQHCQTELTSKRAKQCADCAAIKNDAHRYGTYAATMEAFEMATRQGLSGQGMRDFVLGKKSEATAENYIEADKRRANREAAIRAARYQDRCPDCGGPADFCGGGNCTSNHPNRY